MENNIYDNFKKDFDDIIIYAGASLDDNIITIYLDNDPNVEKNKINKLVRTKYVNSLKKLRSEEDVMKFKILKENKLETKTQITEIKRLQELAGISTENAWDTANPENIYDNLISTDHSELVNRLLETADQNPSLTLMDFLKTFDINDNAEEDFEG